MNKVNKILIIVMILIIFALAIAYTVISMNLAKSIFMPDVLTLKKEEAWEKEHNLWGEYDSYEKVNYKVKGYENYVINAQLVKAKGESNKYVIISHGFRSNRNGAVKYVDVYRNLGYNCIIYDVRGHGENEKSVVTLGNIESKDLMKLIEDTYSRYGKDIYLGLHGESMGSSITLSALGENPKVKFAVVDCGFTNLYQLMKDLYDQNNVGVIIHGVNAVAKYKYGYDMKDTNAIKSLETNNVPICFIHGKEDTFITPENSSKMIEVNKSQDELHLIEGSVHANSREVLGVEGYQKIVGEFLYKVK